MKIIIQFILVHIWIRLEVLLGLKPSGRTDTVTEASNLTDGMYKRIEKQNKQQNGNALYEYKSSKEL